MVTNFNETHLPHLLEKIRVRAPSTPSDIYKPKLSGHDKYSYLDDTRSEERRRPTGRRSDDRSGFDSWPARLDNAVKRAQGE